MLAENLGICFVIRDFEKGRKAVAINLDPVPTFITKCTIKPIKVIRNYLLKLNYSIKT